MVQRGDEASPLALALIARLLSDPVDPEIPEELAGEEELCRIHGYLIRLRATLNQFAVGDFNHVITDRGVIAGRLKALQANLRHMVWQVKQVEEGDFSQRIHFLGEFSESFNSMVTQLDAALTAMRQKEAKLLELSASLQVEIAKRNEALTALEKSEAEFRYLAEHDPLTDVMNRRSFFEMGGITLRHCHKHHLSCCLVMLDVDHFKRFNDTYGHLEGDKALKHVARLSKNSLRQKDILARFGGEEFVFLFSQADLEQGRGAAERIRVSLESHPVVLDNGQEVHITASLGVVQIPTENLSDNPSLLIKAINVADHALYQAKNAGRNIVKVADINEVSEIAVKHAPDSAKEVVSW
jgi:diguanylate cyclase (GGDEF)-like protein